MDEKQIELITCQNEAATLHADDEVIKLFTRNITGMAAIP